MSRMRRLAVALHAVSSSPPMACWRDYVDRVEALRPELPRDNPRGAQLEIELHALVRERDIELGAWVSATRLVTALSSFVDDYVGPMPSDLFEVDAAVALLDAFEGRLCLTVTEQLSLALDAQPARSVRRSLFHAVLALHTATRVLARGRDGRLSPSLALDLDERLRLGRAIAPFHPEDARGGDPLGDTYHYWANVAAGLFAGGGRPTEARRHLVAGLFFAGPALMTTVRQGIFGSDLFYGNHARIDHLGLRHGRALCRALG